MPTAFRRRLVTSHLAFTLVIKGIQLVIKSVHAFLAVVIERLSSNVVTAKSIAMKTRKNERKTST